MGLFCMDVMDYANGVGGPGKSAFSIKGPEAQASVAYGV